MDLAIVIFLLLIGTTQWFHYHSPICHYFCDTFVTDLAVAMCHGFATDCCSLRLIWAIIICYHFATHLTIAMCYEFATDVTVAICDWFELSLFMTILQRLYKWSSCCSVSWICDWSDRCNLRLIGAVVICDDFATDLAIVTCHGVATDLAIIWDVFRINLGWFATYLTKYNKMSNICG